MIELRCQPQAEAPSRILIGRDLDGELRARLQGRVAFVHRDHHAPCPAALRELPTHLHHDGEAGKTLTRCEALLRAMSHAGLDRDGLLINVGGGVVGDLGGLAAALYLRGIEHWHVPTTLLAMVDSSVGGKTAVNLPEGKNLVGAVHPASCTLLDVNLLDGLPEAQFHSGLAEAIKVGIGLDATLFALLERQHAAILARDPNALHEVIVRCVQSKIDVVQRDPREHGERRLLNLGHTLGHALEGWHQYQVPHGHCVAQGLHFALDLAERLGALAAADRQRATNLLAAYRFPRQALPPLAELEPFLRRDKKAGGTGLQFALPTGIGSSRVQALPWEVLFRALVL